MTGTTDAEQPDEWGLVPSDDQFHPPESDDPWWTETVWFSWSVPERNLLGYFYPAFRANLGIQFGGLLVVDDTAIVPWELPVYNWSWHEPLTSPPNLLDAHDLPEGMFLQCHEFGRTYRFGCDNDDMKLDVTFESLCPPLLTREEPPFNFGAHVDQPGRVTGRFVLHGEAMDVDCIAMRDRTWGPRPEHRPRQAAYVTGAVTAEHGFLAVTNTDPAGADPIAYGFLRRDGETVGLAAGRRTVVRDATDGQVLRVDITATDMAGRELRAVGEPVSRMIINRHTFIDINSLVRWDVDGATGWGEDQDMWPVHTYADARRRRAFGPSRSSPSPPSPSSH